MSPSMDDAIDQQEAERHEVERCVLSTAELNRVYLPDR